MNTSAEMPKYKCYKEVHALKIEKVVLDSDLAAKENRETDGSATLAPSDGNFAPFKVDHEFVRKHRPQGSGYYVVYKDGYKSWSPIDAFEEGYEKM